VFLFGVAAGGDRAAQASGEAARAAERGVQRMQEHRWSLPNLTMASGKYF
jgi:hypothetical protein